MQVKVLFFASLVDIVGSRDIVLDVDEGATLAKLIQQLESSYPRLKQYGTVLRTAINEEYSDRSSRVSEGDVVAVFPPVSGGDVSGESIHVARAGEFYEITYDRIDAAAMSQQLLKDDDGAICVFEGVVRNQSKGRRTRYLVYEAYQSMALSKMEEIGQRVKTMWDIDSVAIIHRLGRLEIGESSVAVVVTSPHRRAAFDACHYAIDLLKKVVPIWKKEYFEDGEVWVDGQSTDVSA